MGSTSIVQKYQDPALALARWMEQNVPEGLTVLGLPPAHRRRLRTSNALKQLHKQIKHRTRVVTLFPNEAFVLRLVSTVLTDIN